MTEEQSHRSLVSVQELAALLKAEGERVLVLPVGVPGSGKSTLALKIIAATAFTRINADEIRREVTGDEKNHSRDEVVWGKLLGRLERAIAADEPVLIDNMNHVRQTRADYVKRARDAGYRLVLLFMDVPLEQCLKNNRSRDKDITDFVIQQKHCDMKNFGQPLDDEHAIWVSYGPTPDQYYITTKRPQQSEHGFDLIGDQHGCYDELVELLNVLGYTWDKQKGHLQRPKGRLPVFCGDIIDRGPKPAETLELVMLLVKLGAKIVLGNHCRKLLRLLQGGEVKDNPELLRTVAAIRAHRPGFEKEVLLFLSQVPWIYETKDLIVVHAAYKEMARGNKAMSLAVYGEVVKGEIGPDGFPVRHTSWETGYMGGKTIVHGHIPTNEPTLRHVSNGGCIVNVDTGCCFGNKLTALRFPEMEFISVPAKAVYSARPAFYDEAGADDEGENVSTKLYPNPAVVYAGDYGIGKGLPSFALFNEMEEGGFLWSKQLPTADGLTYRLYNYSKQTTYDRAWNDATMAARGLIVCEQTGEIVAASMGKFFNMGEIITPGRAASLREGQFDTFDKKDGSCGIQYRLDGKVRWATRGAFFSDQAQVAQSLWDERYKQHDELLMTEWNHLTLSAEIIHRSTRVVCIYPYEDLVLIAARNRFTGKHISYAQLLEIGARLGMRVVEKFDFPDPETVLNVTANLDGNTEGFVLCWDDGYRLKVKGEKYKEKHRKLTGITARTIAEAWYDGTLYAMLVDIPEEFRLDAERVMQRLEDDTVELVRSVEEIYAAAADIKERKDYAAWVRTQDKRLTGFLHSRRARDERGGSASVARATLANVIMTGYVYSLLMHSEDDGGLANHLRDYQQAMAMFLWDKTRSRELVNKAKGIAPSMPKQLRSSWDSALVNLQPDLMVERLREFVRSSTDLPEIAAVDVDAVMAAAPSPNSPEQMHHQWVHSQPGLVRTFLDRWRYCGRGETAHVGARKLFADAVRSGVAAEYLTAVSKVIEAHQGKPGFDVQALIDGLAGETALLENDWNALPHGSNPQEISAAAAALGDRSGWAKELLSEAWSAQRAQVRDLYLASDPQLSSLDRLEDA